MFYDEVILWISICSFFGRIILTSLFDVTVRQLTEHNIPEDLNWLWEPKILYVHFSFLYSFL
jgi:hypothetical protein